MMCKTTSLTRQPLQAQRFHLTVDGKSSPIAESYNFYRRVKSKSTPYLKN